MYRFSLYELVFPAKAGIHGGNVILPSFMMRVVKYTKVAESMGKAIFLSGAGAQYGLILVYR